jgi:spore germination cell wall hydrolase CwlJ-like protein
MKTALLLMLAGCIQIQAGVVALTILAEARGEGRDGMAAVACVIAQRAENRSITPEKVCLQKWQFSCWNGKTEQDLDHLYKSPMADWALYLEENIRNMNRAKVGFADHYYADWIKAPYWAKGKKPVAVIGKHKFYRLKK